MTDLRNAHIEEFPDCDICQILKAQYDGKTVNGPWAYMCSDCFSQKGIGLGMGKGQKLVLAK